jgi:zinc transporter, ZIP family
VFGVWGIIAAISALAAVVGDVLFKGLPAEWIAATTAVAAGAILAMLADTMVREAVERAHNFTGLITVTGFLAAFVLSKASGG